MIVLKSQQFFDVHWVMRSKGLDNNDELAINMRSNDGNMFFEVRFTVGKNALTPSIVYPFVATRNIKVISGFGKEMTEQAIKVFFQRRPNLMTELHEDALFLVSMGKESKRLDLSKR